MRRRRWTALRGWQPLPPVFRPPPPAQPGRRGKQRGAGAGVRRQRREATGRQQGQRRRPCQLQLPCRASSEVPVQCRLTLPLCPPARLRHPLPAPWPASARPWLPPGLHPTAAASAGYLAGPPSLRRGGRVDAGVAGEGPGAATAAHRRSFLGQTCRGTCLELCSVQACARGRAPRLQSLLHLEHCPRSNAPSASSAAGAAASPYIHRQPPSCSTNTYEAA